MVHPFYEWVVFHCVYIPHFLYPFICWLTLRLLPCLGYWKQCCCEHWVNEAFFLSSSGHATSLVRSWFPDQGLNPATAVKYQVLITACHLVFEEPLYCFAYWLHQFTIPPRVDEFPFLHSFSSIYYLEILMMAILPRVRYLTVVSISISLIFSDVLCICRLSICMTPTLVQKPLGVVG